MIYTIWKGGDSLAKKFYTVKRAANMLGITEQTLRNYLNHGRIKGEKKYNSTVISKEEIERYDNYRKELEESSKKV